VSPQIKIKGTQQGLIHSAAEDARPESSQDSWRWPTSPGCAADEDAQGLALLVELGDHPVAIDVLFIQALAANDAE
jgi:hypothetical protein